MAQRSLVRLGLVGCGSVAIGMHLNGWTRFSDKARLQAVFDVDEGRSNRMAGLVEGAYQARAYEHTRLAAQAAAWEKDRAAEAQHLERAAIAGEAAVLPTVYNDLDKLLGDPRIDAVIVATPHHLHAPLSARALAAGKHVFSEGPMAINLEQADAVLAAQRKSGKVYSAQYYSRYFRGSRQAYRLAQSGKLGKILMSRGDALWYRPQRYYDQDAWRGTRAAGDRVYIHHGRYAMDLYLWVTNEPIEEVYAFADTKTHDIQAEDNAAVQVRFRSGAYGQLMLSTSAHPPTAFGGDVERVEILGERASFSGVLDYRSEDCAVTIGSREASYADELRRWIADEPPSRSDGATTHYEAFVDAIQGGPPMLTQPESTRAQVELARAIGRSRLMGKPVSLPIKPGEPFYGPVDGYDD
jgi:UDP-N-acetyl-2-amino-2-deoxyglucuronate dehydrogenase